MIGVIQGRLSPRPFPKLQEFPTQTWRDEFGHAKDLGFDYIEWIFEANDYEKNPLWTPEGRAEIKTQIQGTGIPVGSICADYFLELPFYRCTGEEYEERIAILEDLIRYASEIGARNILLPVLEEAELRTSEEGVALIEAVKRCVPLLEEHDVYLGYETELDKEDYLKLCQAIENSHVGAYYDTGNCAACGHDMKEDMEVLYDQLIAVHIKDRKLHGPSVPAGIGDVNFEGGIAFLNSHGFAGNYTLQTYFGENHLSDTADAKRYISSLVEKG